jgi:hypothetical protein
MKVKLTLLLLLGLVWGTVQAKSPEPVHYGDLEAQAQMYKETGQPLPAELLQKIRQVYGLKDDPVPEGSNRVGGDVIAAATGIPGLPYSDSGNTCGYVDDYDEACYASSNSPDVVYVYSPAANEVVDITLCNGSSYDTKLFIYEDTYTPGAPFACNDDSCPGYVSELIGLSLVGGSDYYIVVDGYGGDCGDYILDVTWPAAPTPGDDCIDPLVVSIPADLPYQDLTQTTCGRGNSYDATCLGSYDGGDDIIYELIVTSEVTLDFLMSTTTTWTGMLIDDDCPGDDGDCIVYGTSIDAGGVNLNGVLLTAGTYYLMIDTYPSPYCIPEFDLSITAAAPPPPGDSCADPYDFPALPATQYETTADNSNTDGNASNDEWWDVTIPEDGTYTISLCGSSYDTYLWLMEDECASVIGYNDDACGIQSELTVDLTTGNYIVCVEGYSSFFGDYILDIYRNYERHVPGDYPTIQDAIDASFEDDTIVLDGGRAVYREQLYITHSLDILGAGMDVTTLEMPDLVDQTSFDITTWTGSVKTVYAVIGIDGAGTVNIDGLTVDGRQEAAASMYGVYYYDTDGAMTDCRITNITHPTQPGNQSVVNYCATHSDGGSFDVEVSGCELPNMQKCGLLFMGPEGNCVVDDNDVDDTVSDDIAGNGMQISYGCTGTVTDNDVSGLYYSGTDWGSTGILLFECGDVSVSGGQVYQCEMGVNHSQWNWVYTPVAAPVVAVADVTVDECDWGVGTHLGSTGALLDLSVNGCFITDGTYSSVDLWGSDIDPWGGGYYNGWTGGTLNAEVHSNYMSNGDGIVEMVELTGNTVNVNAHNNSFANVGDYGVYNDYTNTIDAENNWWGDAAGPTVVTLTDYSQQQRQMPSPVLVNDMAAPAGAVDREKVAHNLRTGVNVSPFVDFDPWFLTDGYQLDQTADFYHISVDDPGLQTPEHDPLQYQTTVTYDLAMATPTENWRSTTAFIEYDPLVLNPVAVTKIYDPAGGADNLMSNLLNSPNGMLEVTWYLTGITPGVQGGHTLFSVTFDGLTEDVNPGTLIHLDQVVIRNPDNQPVTATGGSDIYINVDHSPPLPFVATPPGNSNINADPVIQFSAADNVDLHRIDYEIVGYAWDFAIDSDIAGPAWSGSWTMDVSGIPDGDYTVNFRCWDDVGYFTDATPWSFHLDRGVPTPPADLTAKPRCGLIHLEWTAATEHDTYELWREKRVTYPYFYDYGAGTGGLPPASGTYTTMIPLAGGLTAYDDDWGVDELASRAVYDYKLIAVDSINPPAESGTAAATNYYLGDWYVPYDCNVGAGDLAALSIHYGTVSQLALSDELDVAPTSDWGRFGLPGPDGLINFEDLIVMAMNYRATGPPIPFNSCWPLYAKDEQPQVDQGLVATLYDEPENCELVVNGTMFAMSIELATTRQLISARANDMLVLTYPVEGGWMIDMAAMGELQTEQTIVELQFQLDAEPGAIEVVTIDARGAENNSLPVAYQDSDSIPTEFSLAQNYPNPFNPVTTINYDLAATVQVELLVYNSLGQQVATLVNDTQPAGRYSVSFDGSRLASGLYLYRLSAGDFVQTERMLLLK